MEKLKNIRFNLRFFNGSESFESIHSTEELEDKLRTNQIAFDDLMAYFFSGQLQRWLECHGAKDAALLEKLRNIDTKAPNKQIVLALFAALDFCFDEQEIDRMIVSYDFPARLQKATQECSKTAEVQLNSMQNEIDSYEAMCRQILTCKDDRLAVRKAIAKLVDRYYPVLELDIVRFFRLMRKESNGCPWAILELLSNRRGRSLFVTKGDANVSSGADPAYPKPRAKVEGWLSFQRGSKSSYVQFAGVGTFTTHEMFSWIASEDLDAAYSAFNSSKWKQVVPVGKRVMILCNDGVNVKGRLDGSDELSEWSEYSLDDRFLIFNGCSYSVEHKTKAILAYVEI